MLPADTRVTGEFTPPVSLKRVAFPLCRLTRRFKLLRRLVHPDKNVGVTGADFTRAFQELTTAYERLKSSAANARDGNRDARADARRRQRGDPCPARDSTPKSTDPIVMARRAEDEGAAAARAKVDEDDDATEGSDAPESYTVSATVTYRKKRGTQFAQLTNSARAASSKKPPDDSLLP